MTNCFGVLLLSGALVSCGDGANDGLLLDGPLGPGPVPPPAQGASVFSLQPAMPEAPGKSCPVASSQSALPEVTGPKALSETNYEERVTDGEAGVSVQCSVAGTTTFTFEGTIQLGGRAFRISNGALAADRKGSAEITLSDQTLLPSSIASSRPCAVDAAKANGNNFQVKPGSMWASFDCAAVEAAPSDLCAATGIFVFENCRR